MNKKTFVFIHLYNDRSGSPKILRDVINIAQKNNIPFYLMTSSNSGGFLSEVKCNKINIFYGRSTKKIVNMLLFLISQLSLFIKILRFWNSDVVIYVNTMMPISAGIASWLMGKKCIYHIHETSIRPIIFKKLARYVIKKTASIVIYPSKYLMDKEAFGANKNIVIYNSTSMQSARADIKNYNQKHFENFTVMMACSLKKYKGIDEFIKLAQIIDNKKIKFKLILNADEREIKKYFANSTIPNNITIKRRQINMEDHYLCSDIVLNLSRPNEWIETFGLTIIEAMSFGLVVIAPPVGGPAELITHGKNGFLISSSDIYEIKNIIFKLYFDKNLYNSIATCSFLRSLDFTEEIFERAIKNLLFKFQL